MRYFIDTEFIEDGKTIELISIGIQREDGHYYYAESADVDLGRANDWVKENVLPGLEGGISRRSREDIRANLLKFVDLSLGKPEFWSYYGAYDHVALCQLFGKMVDLPKGWPMYTNDIKQWAFMLGDPTLPPERKDEHHALADARWNKKAWEFLYALQQGFNIPNAPYIVDNKTRVFPGLRRDFKA